MKYKILKRIQDGTTNSGYQLVSEDNKILFASRATVIRLAGKGDIIGIKYNKSSNSLVSTDPNTSLRELEAIKLQDIYNKLNTLANNLNTQPSTQAGNTGVVPVNSANKEPKQMEYVKKANKMIESDNKNDIKGTSYNNVSFKDICNGWVDRRLTRAQQAEQFLKRGSSLLDLHIANDHVSLYGIKEMQDGNMIIIPEFVSSIALSAFSTGNMYHKDVRIIIRGTAKNCGTLDLSSRFERCKASSLEIIVEDSDRISSMNEMFRENEHIKSVKMMFMNASFNNLNNICGEGLMDYMFYNCKNLERVEIYANTWGCQCITRDRIYIKELFSGCSKLEYVDLSGFEYTLNRASDITNFFSGCRLLQFIDLSFLKGNNLGRLRNGFNACESLRGIDLSGLDTDKEIRCHGSFYLDYNLDGVATRNKSIIAELKRFNDEDLAKHNKAIRTTVELSNGTRISLEEADMRKRAMAESEAELRRIYELLTSSLR